MTNQITTSTVIDKKPRTMSLQGFLKKATSKASVAAGAFLQAHREYLTTGELAPVTSPIIKRLDDQEILPTPALQEIQLAVMNHIIAVDMLKMEDAAERQQKSASPKKWIAMIFDSNGTICTEVNEDGEVKDLLKAFDDSSSADRWIDRKLFDGQVDWYGSVDSDTLNVHTTINRLDSMARFLKQKKGPSVHVKGKTTKRLGWQMKAVQSRSSFSHG